MKITVVLKYSFFFTLNQISTAITNMPMKKKIQNMIYFNSQENKEVDYDTFLFWRF